jgi:hypothetical protein
MGQQNGMLQALISLAPVFVPKLTLCETQEGAEKVRRSGPYSAAKSE